MNNKLIVTAALLGNGTTKQMNPAVPYTPEEIARDAVACVKAGRPSSIFMSGMMKAMQAWKRSVSLMPILLRGPP